MRITIGFLGLESIENSSYAMIEKASNDPNYRGELEIKLDVNVTNFG